VNSGALQRFSRGVKKQLLWVFIALGIGFGSTLYFREDVFAFLLAPSRGLLSPTSQPIFTSPTEMFSSTIRLAVTGGIVVALPVVLASFSRLLIPLLLPSERRFIFLFFFPAAMLCFLAGVSFAYYILLPAGLGFLLQFGTNIATPTIRISAYMSLATSMLLWMGVVFELPLGMYVLARLRMVSHTQFRRFRKYVPPTAIIFAAIITPTFDGLNVMLIAIPLTVLFEVGLALAWVARPVERKRWNSLRTAMIEAIFLAVIMAGLVALLFYAGVLGG
jgi:sec-independent protein translocase protein TatC